MFDTEEIIRYHYLLYIDGGVILLVKLIGVIYEIIIIIR